MPDIRPGDFQFSIILGNFSLLLFAFKKKLKSNRLFVFAFSTSSGDDESYTHRLVHALEL